MDNTFSESYRQGVDIPSKEVSEELRRRIGGFGQKVGSDEKRQKMKNIAEEIITKARRTKLDKLEAALTEVLNNSHIVKDYTYPNSGRICRASIAMAKAVSSVLEDSVICETQLIKEYKEVKNQKDYFRQKSYDYIKDILGNMEYAEKSRMASDFIDKYFNGSLADDANLYNAIRLTRALVGKDDVIKIINLTRFFEYYVP